MLQPSEIVPITNSDGEVLELHREVSSKIDLGWNTPTWHGNQARDHILALYAGETHSMLLISRASGHLCGYFVCNYSSLSRNHPRMQLGTHCHSVT